MANVPELGLLDGLVEVLQISRGVLNEITANGILNRSQYLRIQEVVALLTDFTTHFNNNFNDQSQAVDEIVNGLTNLADFFHSNLSELNERAVFEEQADCFQVSEYRTGKPGRPSVIIVQEQVEGLRSIGMTWENISKLLGVSSRTLRTKRQEFKDFIDFDYSEIDDNALDQIISNILQSSPNMGERMLLGALRSRKLKIQRWKIRESISRVDPIGRSMRRLTVIRRRKYNVKCPNALW